MSKRGLQYNHNVGDHVLCFEPDPKKVRVIYPAKVMEHAVRKQTDSPHRVAAYRVHFQGWKASWDREVTEDMLLPDTTFNRELMFRIDEITRRTRRIEEVRERIDKVLTHVRRLRASGKLASAEEEEEFDWSQVDGIMPPLPVPQDTRGRKDRGRKGSTDARDESDEEEDGTHAENLEVHSGFLQPLQPLPLLLRRVLEADQRRVQADPGANLSLDGGPTVLRFLEDFLAHASARPARPHQQQQQQAGAAFWTEEYARADRSLRLAFEVASSLRILTDVLFLEELLYPRERPLFARGSATASARRRGAATAALAAISQNVPEPDVPVALALLPADVKAAGELPTCVCPVIFLLRLLVLLPDLIDSMDLTLCRRAIISRHVTRLIKYMENSVSSWFPHPVDSEENGSEADVTSNAAAATAASSSSRRRKRVSDAKR